MAHLDFPNAPTVGDKYPPTGLPQYTWDGEKWTVPSGAPASFPDAPSDGSLYGRMSNAWEKAVKKSGDTMTGTLQISGPNFTDGVKFNNTTTGKQETLRASSAAVGGLEVINNAFTGAILTLDDTGNFGVGGNITANAAIAGASLTTSGAITGGSLTTSGALTVNSPGQANFNNGWIAYNGAGVVEQGSGSNVMVQGAGGGNSAMMTFHRPGAFATNFGLNASNRFGHGGWSAGAAFYQFWSTQDCGLPASNGRLALAGDQQFSSAAGINVIAEPYGGAVMTGWAWTTSGGVNIVQYFRFRYMQIYTNAWYTCGYA